MLKLALNVKAGVVLSLLTLAGVASAETWYSPYCTSGTLKQNGIGKQHTCEKIESNSATCPVTGSTLKTDIIGIDMCEKISMVPSATECDLFLTDIKDNWKIVVKAGVDHCEHKTENKGQKPVKCSVAGATKVTNGDANRDTCKKETETRTESKCESGYTRKTAGSDKCEKTSYSAPAFR